MISDQEDNHAKRAPAERSPVDPGVDLSDAPGGDGAETVAHRSWRHSARQRVARFDESVVLAALVGLVLIIGLPHGSFFDLENLLSIGQSAGIVAIVAYGMVFLMAMGDIDLSVAGTYGLSALGAAELMNNGMDPWLAAAIGLLIGLTLGFINGALASLLRIRVLILSIGTLTLYEGLTTGISGGTAPENLPFGSSFFSVLGGKLLGVPVTVWVTVVLGVLLTVVFLRTPFGARAKAIGSNPAAARVSGIPVDRTRIGVLALIGLLCGVSGVLSLAYFQGADPTIGNGFELQVIAATIIGGTGVTGGSGTVPGALLGALVVAVINSGLVFFHISPNWNDVVTGSVVVLAVGSDALTRHRKSAARA